MAMNLMQVYASMMEPANLFSVCHVMPTGQLPSARGMFYNENP